MSEARWKEGRRGEIDLTSDPQVDNRSLSSVLTFLMSDCFDADGDTVLAFAVRGLADRWGLPGLVDKAESELVGLLCADNALSFLGQVIGTHGRLEHACLSMIQARDCELLEQQRDRLDGIILEDPCLAGQLFRSLLGVRHKKRRLC